jgi:hypothetical protein
LVYSSQCAQQPLGQFGSGASIMVASAVMFAFAVAAAPPRKKFFWWCIKSEFVTGTSQWFAVSDSNEFSIFKVGEFLF